MKVGKSEGTQTLHQKKHSLGLQNYLTGRPHLKAYVFHEPLICEHLGRVWEQMGVKVRGEEKCIGSDYRTLPQENGSRAVTQGPRVVHGPGEKTRTKFQGWNQ